MHPYRVLIFYVFFFPSSFSFGDSVEEALAGLDVIYERAKQGGEVAVYEALLAWEEQHTNEIVRRHHDNLRLKSLDNSVAAFQLLYKKQPLYDLKRYISRGRTALVFETMHGTALKVTRYPEEAASFLLQTWIESKLNKYQVQHSKILKTGEYGLSLETELVPGQDLQYIYPLSGREPSEEMVVQILKEWQKLRALAVNDHLFISFKAANYHANDDGKIILVDAAPRLHETRARYIFDNNDGHPLSEAEALQMFLYYAMKAHVPKNVPGKTCSFSFNGDRFEIYERR